MTTLAYLGLESGFFLNTQRTVELGASMRIGSELAHGGVCFLPTLHFSYLWPLWD